MTLTELIPILPRAALNILIADFLRYFVVAATAYGLIWRVLGSRLKQRRVLDAAPKAGQMWREFKHALGTVLVFAASGVLIFSLEKLGFTRLYGPVERYGWAWWWASIAVLIVAHDAYFYWTHRLLHCPWWFAKVHHIHHQSRHPTPWAAYSFHPVEALIQAIFLVTAVLALPLNGMAIFIFLLWMIVRNVLGHSGHELMSWHALRHGWLRSLTSTSHHHFHHAFNQGNFGLYFTWWDRLMGTEDPQHLVNGDARWPTTRPINQPGERA